MNTITKYKIQRVTAKIYSVHISNKYDRAMTFCRAQEYYESPNPDFKGKAFSIWEYIKWYSLQNGKGFTYGLDWSGFNIPIETIKNCYNGILKKYGERELTMYDNTLLKIVDDIENLHTNEPAHPIEQSYLIGVDSSLSETFKHEVCHGLYSTEESYQKRAKKLTAKLLKKNPKVYQTFKANLLSMGYATDLVDDEIQAYVQFGVEDKEFSKGTDKEIRKELNLEFTKYLYHAFTKG
jgi:hypothetical protein